MPIRLIRIAFLAAALAAPATAAAGSTDDRAERALQKVSVRMTDRHTAVVKEGFESTLFYKVCLRRKAKPRVKSCRQGETNAFGVGRVSFAGFVARNGRGKYVATWTGGGLELGTATVNG